MRKRIVIALGGNALGSNLPEQMKAVPRKVHKKRQRRRRMAVLQKAASAVDNKI